VLLATPESERYTTAPLLADHVFRAAGYRTVLLGEGIPLAALGEALARHRPAIVALSRTVTFPAGSPPRLVL
jgi:methanogenic corrinoid protein MtbC1